MTRFPWRWVRTVAGTAVLGAVLWRTGSEPFLVGLRSLDAATLAIGAAIAVPTTVACAWRWHLVARGLGVGIELGPAVAACYRAQFLNVTLPGGLLGDVHRGVRHGLATGQTGRGLRSVVWERVAGQVVLVTVVLAALVLLPSPVGRPTALLVVLAVALLVAAALLLRLLPPTAPGSLVRRTLRRLGEDVRCTLLDRRAWPGVVLASTVAVAGHLATYLVAARAVGVPAAPLTLLPLALLVLLAAGLPLNVAGWGPREGMAAWMFAAAGLGAGHGVAAAVAYGAMVLVASLPGAAVLAVASGAPSRPGSTSARARVPEGGRAGG